ncbi:hypothetical protein CCHR01_01559 [Colletotrichum chrysophilum]|uniref:Uncharacterized protein n=1 Tax=Colletotrichum chrysophilum TaxID=1836956 RepID=A0AAD9ET98_9PEZI|nr:hypothetical protein CCHR01_01559 [Colletotrichum chrysophilum]
MALGPWSTFSLDAFFPSAYQSRLRLSTRAVKVATVVVHSHRSVRVVELPTVVPAAPLAAGVLERRVAHLVDEEDGDPAKAGEDVVPHAPSPRVEVAGKLAIVVEDPGAVGDISVAHLVAPGAEHALAGVFVRSTPVGRVGRIDLAAAKFGDVGAAGGVVEVGGGQEGVPVLRVDGDQLDAALDGLLLSDVERVLMVEGGRSEVGTESKLGRNLAQVDSRGGLDGRGGLVGVVIGTLGVDMGRSNGLLEVVVVAVLEVAVVGDGNSGINSNGTHSHEKHEGHS